MKNPSIPHGVSHTPDVQGADARQSRILAIGRAIATKLTMAGILLGAGAGRAQAEDKPEGKDPVVENITTKNEAPSFLANAFPEATVKGAEKGFKKWQNQASVALNLGVNEPDPEDIAAAYNPGFPVNGTPEEQAAYRERAKNLKTGAQVNAELQKGVVDSSSRFALALAAAIALGAAWFGRDRKEKQ